MPLWFKLLLFVHLVALTVGAATNIVMPLLARTLMPEGRGTFLKLADRLGGQAQVALWVLVATGLAMAIPVHFAAGLAGIGGWFAAKLVLVVLILVLTTGRYLGLDLPPRIFAPLVRATLLGIVFCAVMAFG